MHQINILLISLMIISCSENQKLSSNLSEETKENFTFQPYLKDQINIEYSDSILTTMYPSSVIILKDFIIWAEEFPPIYLLDKYGKSIRIIGLKGRGPGEITSIRGIDFDLFGNYYIYDNSQLKILIFDKDFKYKNQMTLKRNFRKFVVDNFSNIYCLLHDKGSDRKGAIIKYDKYGNIIGEWGEIPLGARFHRRLIGGGLCIDNENNVYFSYIGDYRIWKSDSIGNNLRELNEKPEGFIEVDTDYLEKLNRNEVVKYHFEVSRTMGLFYLDDGYLVQVIRNPIENSRKYNEILVIRDLDGKIENQIKGLSNVVSTTVNDIITLEEAKKENENSKIKIYGLKYEKK